MRIRVPLFCALLAACMASAMAAPRRIELTPSTSEVGFRGYGLGLLPLDGRFTRFGGSLTYDPADHSNCGVDLVVDVASLVTEDPSMRTTVVGPDFMDAASFPSLTYAGACQGPELHGTLGMHGVVRPFELSLDWGQAGVVAEGRLRRADWGMTAMPILGGRTVRIRVTVPLRDSP
jgi:polyisoprenoid-binding protein YceI